MSLLIQKGGILTTIQDLGRYGYRRFGINPNGVMDQIAARLLNILVGNDENEALLEMHFPSPEITFESNTIFALSGGDFAPQLDRMPIENWRPIFAKKGSTLTFTGKISGNRAYLAIRGGLKIDKWLESSSTNLIAKIGGSDGRKVVTGDRIATQITPKKTAVFEAAQISASLIPRYSRFPTVRIIAGAEFEKLNEKSRDLLVSENFTISTKSNRMGFRLSGESLHLAKPFELVSSAACFGTIQLLPDGQLIVLMADHQTAGGYPRVGHVISRDLPLVSQLGANDKVSFHLINNRAAEDLALEFERELCFLRIGCKFQAHYF